MEIIKYPKRQDPLELPKLTLATIFLHLNYTQLLTSSRDL